MKLFSAFKTLPWEQRDPERRAIAVRDEQAPELLAKLPAIAAEDAEPAVRRAALARLSDPAFLLARQRNDGDAQTRAAALARASRLLLDPAGGLSLDARTAALSDPALPAELLERIAETAPESALRRAALARVSRPGLLQRRCAEDPDAGIREELLARIDSEEVLDKLADSLRKRDKNLARRARDRVHALRLARGDAATLQQYALSLCDTLTQWAQRLPHDLAAQIDAARSEWETRRGAFDASMQRRVDAYFERVDAASARREGRSVAVVAVSEPSMPATSEGVAPADAANDAAPHHANATAAVTDAASVPPPASDAVATAHRPAKSAPDFTALDAALKDAERALAAQRLGEARPLFEQARALVKSQRPDAGRRERYTRIEEKFEELEQWQRWSGNRVRARLCDDLEALIAAGHHPDAVANRVKELQQEWAKVEATEPGDADRGSGLARRFRALCAKAMAPTKAYFDQRHALREQRRIALDAVIAQADEEPVSALSVPAAIALRRQLVEALRTLDELEPKARTSAARRLREGLSRLDARLSAQREDAALGRRKLIARLRRELTHADPQAALDLARDAQQEWKTLPRASKEQEPALEQELRALIDPLFAQEREQREQSQQEVSRVESESRRVLAELEALAAGDAETLAHAEGRIAALQATWRELHAKQEEPSPPRDARGAERGRDANRSAPRGGRDGGRDDRRGDSRGRDDARRGDPRMRGPRPADTDRPFDQAVARVRSAQGLLEEQRRGARLHALADAAALLSRVASSGIAAADAQAGWDALGLEDADRRRLDARWQAATSGAAPAADEAVQQAADRWLVEAELDAGLESPDTAQALRRQAQMQRLQTRMQGAAASAIEPRERLLQWIELGALPAARGDSDQTRIARLLDAWLQR